MNFTDRIKPDSASVGGYLEQLRKKNFQIPTFQREVVWEKENVKKLWDSIYKFYPLGSILVWKTDIKLQNHREIGGHLITDSSFDRSEYQYILDGQQRTTSLLTSLYGGKIDGLDDFDPTIYIDLTIEDETEVDDESYKKRFLYFDEINDKGGKVNRNKGKQDKYDAGLIVKLHDIKYQSDSIEEKLANSEEFNSFNHPVRKQLRHFREVLNNYRLSFIELKGIQVSEVCQIFERINQAGKPLDIFDIVVAKTFRPTSEKDSGFYLRDYIDQFRKSKNQSNYLDISDKDYLQILAILIREYIPDSGIYNITDRYLNDLQADQIEDVWDSAKKAILKTFDFFEHTLNLKGPQLIPYRYLYLTLAYYFYENSNPDYNFLKQYYWFHSLHKDDQLKHTQHLNEHIEFLKKQRETGEVSFPRFLIDRDTLRKSSYSSKGRLSRAILSLYSSKEPKDWKFTDRKVQVDNIFFSTDKPNLHHIFPTNYISQNPGKNQLDNNSLMNIAYLTQQTNLEISDKNPLSYIREYNQNPDFEEVIKSHLIPTDLLEWSRMEEMPNNALDQFIEKRIDFLISELRDMLSGINFEEIDTKEKIENEEVSAA
jgi:hypothetical protein